MKQQSKLELMIRLYPQVYLLLQEIIHVVSVPAGKIKLQAALIVSFFCVQLIVRPRKLHTVSIRKF